jgi:hypothetical protein
LQKIFSNLQYKKIKIPFYSSLLGGSAVQLNAQHFMRVGREPIQFDLALDHMGDQFEGHYDYIDVGPFGSLAGIVRQSKMLDNDARSFSLLSPFGDPCQMFQKLLEEKADVIHMY